jgi:hypothetical protein
MAELNRHLDAAAARDILLHPGGYSRAMVALAASVIVAEYDRLRELEHAVVTENVFDQLERHRRLRHRLWILLGREDGVGLDIELLDAVADAASAARRRV